LLQGRNQRQQALLRPLRGHSKRRQHRTWYGRHHGRVPGEISPMMRTFGNRAGNALIEFALGSGILVMAFVGTFQFGYTFLQYNNLENAVARGARYASLVPYDSPTTAPSAAFQTAVQNMVLYGNPTAGGAAVLSGLTAGNVILTVTFTNQVPSAMTVWINGY